MHVDSPEKKPPPLKSSQDPIQIHGNRLGTHKVGIIALTILCFLLLQTSLYVNLQNLIFSAAHSVFVDLFFLCAMLFPCVEWSGMKRVNCLHC